MNIDGAVAIVTGGASGLGNATARALHERGAQVVLIDLPSSRGTDAAAAIGEGAHFVAALLAHERLPERRRDRDQAELGIGVLGQHQFVRHLAIALAQREPRSERRPIVRDLVEIHQLDLRDARPQHRDASLDEPLALLRGGVLRVLAQIAVLAGALDFLRQILRQLALELRDFVLEAFDQPRFHDQR